MVQWTQRRGWPVPWRTRLSPFLGTILRLEIEAGTIAGIRWFHYVHYPLRLIFPLTLSDVQYLSIMARYLYSMDSIIIAFAPDRECVLCPFYSVSCE